MYVSDSHVISALLHLDRAPGVADWVRGMSETEFFASVITLDEIEGGIQLQIPRNREFAVSLQAWINRMTIFLTAGFSTLASRKRETTPNDVRAYLAAARKTADKAQASLATLRVGGDCPEAALDVNRHATMSLLEDMTGVQG